MDPNETTPAAAGAGAGAGAGGTRELSPTESWDLLRQGIIGRLAVIHDGAPDIFPVNYAAAHGTVVLRTAAGTKLDAARNQAVAFEVDGYDLERAEAWSVVIRGTAREVTDLDETIAVMRLPLHPWAGGSKPHLLRLLPDTVSGRRIHVVGGVREL
ncbi:flavin-nucleotide-binding protein [Knoellia sinensis KCTC 19936]|uniref:Flavin-nucleotide-binding protein n=1 Tax=Knoellia sinensis KCTC 19936 TaxID=1385520 RepID=A0A0A0JB90_9MICO|nr:pyridoxamine 5'-phosphate oxidase family protein [Knoellia sinensis]KGN33292.1 flavin-nucleotide-binding protein [Knoellia sinensis KCTC 19936]